MLHFDRGNAPLKADSQPLDGMVSGQTRTWRESGIGSAPPGGLTGVAWWKGGLVAFWPQWVGKTTDR